MKVTFFEPIENCRQCSAFLLKDRGVTPDTPYCRARGSWLIPVTGSFRPPNLTVVEIPDWCPLPDVPTREELLAIAKKLGGQELGLRRSSDAVKMQDLLRKWAACMPSQPADG